VLLHLLGPLGYSAEQVSTLLNKESGMLGLAGFNDMRDIEQALAAGDARACPGLRPVRVPIRQYVGAYAATLNGLDAIVFTAGVGENDAWCAPGCARACSSSACSSTKKRISSELPACAT
jgi:acetate kinase